MVEKIKTVLLMTLIAASLVQTFLLVMHRPGAHAVNPSGSYVKAELGTRLEMERLLSPRDIVLHLGDARHTLAYQGSHVYNAILDLLKQGRIREVKEVPAQNIDEAQMRNERKGIELRFHTAIDAEQLEVLMDVPFTFAVNMAGARIHRVWLVDMQDSAIHLYFDAGDRLFFSDNSGITTKQFEAVVEMALENPDTLYHTDDGRIYFPEGNLEFERVRIPYIIYTSEQLRNSLFTDPGASRSMVQRNGTEIITDGKRALQVSRESHWMIFTDPAVSNHTMAQATSTLQDVWSFINNNGGWNGLYKLSKLPEQDSWERKYEFNRYYQFLPVVSTEPMSMEKIFVTTQGKQVIRYERSLIHFELEQAQKMPIGLYGGQALRDKFRQYARSDEAVQMYPVYVVHLASGLAELTPEWAVELNDGTIEILR